MSDGTPIIVKKKKVAGHGGHHGGSWKVAYADFVTAMMAFFMVMWIMGLSEQNRNEIQGYFNDPLGIMKQEPRSETVVPMPSFPRPKAGASPSSIEGERADEARVHQLEEKIKGELSKDPAVQKLLKDVQFTVTPDGLRIELVESTDAAFFESGSAVLQPAAVKVIDHIAPLLSQAHRNIIVEGHTDSVPYPSASYTNWDLSSDRANAVRRQLSAAGVSDSEFKGVRALADTQPRFPNDPADPRNRRVTLLLPYQVSPSSPNMNLPQTELSKKLAVSQGAIPPSSGAAPPTTQTTTP